MKEEKLKEAFSKVRSDIDFLYKEMQEIKRTLSSLVSQQTNKPTLQHINPTNQHINPTQITRPIYKAPLKGLKRSNKELSTRNEGVPTNQPTNQQTNQHPMISSGKVSIGAPSTFSVKDPSSDHLAEAFAKDSSINISKISSTKELPSPLLTKEYQDSFTTQSLSPPNQDRISQLQRVSSVIASLDDIKKEVRIKFKQLTPQEMLIFQSIYQLEEQGLLVDYSLLSEKLKLTEISIRDYIRKITKKGIEINKIKQNNKKIILSIPQELKQIASLNTILKLREL